MSAERNFIKRFEALEVLLTEFSHAAHVRLAWAYLQESPLPEAIICFRDSLKKFAAHHGKSTLYHETITFAFMLIIHERMHAQGQVGADWLKFAELNQDLLNEGKSLLLKFYREETLSSTEAKRVYRLPDRQ